jgi:serine protease inhibitor
MGFKNVFDDKMANLDRILSLASRNIKIFVDTVIHKAIMTVDEDGTEAAAVTSRQLLLAN